MRPTAEVWVGGFGGYFQQVPGLNSRLNATLFPIHACHQLPWSMNERTATALGRALRVVYATTVPRERDAWPRMTGARIATDRTDVAASRPIRRAVAAGCRPLLQRVPCRPVRICST
eukprot:5991469-Prymnesium_polylepis.1